MAGKGDTRRKAQVTESEFSDNWDRIFNNAKENTHKPVQHTEEPDTRDEAPSDNGEDVQE